MKENIIQFIFSDSLKSLLSPQARKVVHNCQITRRASIKDIIESFGIPHTEIGRIETEAGEVGFAFIPRKNDIIRVQSFNRETCGKLPIKLWPEQWEFAKFMVDINVLKLARNLRLTGFDATVVPDMSLKEIGLQAAQQQRVLLTRNRELLKCGTVKFGQLLRSQNHQEQLKEVVYRFNLESRVLPFTRCLECNGILKDVDKGDILDFLEPLTKKYYQTFMRCSDCQKIYWRGTHVEKMREIIEDIQ